MRSLLIKAHLYIGAFFLPVLLLMAVSGGLYLLGIKGTVQTEPVVISNPTTINPDSPDLRQDIDGLLQSNGIVHPFEYVKVSGTMLTTRPTSRDYYTVDVSTSVPVVTFNRPDLVKRIVELHKGHGPGAFKLLQKIMAAGLIIMLLTGFWLGINSPGLRNVTMVTTGAGLVVGLGLGFLA